MPYINAADGTTWLPYYISIRLKYSFRQGPNSNSNSVSFVEMEERSFLVMKAEQERRSAMIRTKGERKAAELILEATTAVGTSIWELMRTEAVRETVATLAKSPNFAYLRCGGKNGNNNQFLLANNYEGIGGEEFKRQKEHEHY